MMTKLYENDITDVQVGTFAWALVQLNLNKLVSRTGWNGKKMYLVLSPKLTGLTVNAGSQYALSGIPVGKKYDYLTHIDLCNVNGDFVPWQPSQTDMMADDWALVDLSIDLKDPFIFEMQSGEVSRPEPTEKYRGYFEYAACGSYKLIKINSQINNAIMFIVYSSEQGSQDKNALQFHFTPVEGVETSILIKMKLIIKVDGEYFDLGVSYKSTQFMYDISKHDKLLLSINDLTTKKTYELEFVSI